MRLWDSAAPRFENSLENVQSGSRNVISRGKIRGPAEISAVILGLFSRG